MKKAPHFGHCQACGRLHKHYADGKGMALHGYTVAHGFFSGVCPGSRELAFELSCGLIERFIERAKSERVSLIAERESYLTPSTPRIMAHVWHSGGGRVRGHYGWVPATVSGAERPLSDGHRYVEYTIVLDWEVEGNFGKKKTLDSRRDGIYGVDAWEMPDATLDALVLASAKKMSSAYVKFLDKQIADLDRYIAWQGKRVVNWTPAPLLPVKTKDTDAFTPEAV